MDIYDLINDFLEHLEIESGRSKKTIDNYRLYLERFVEISLEILNKDEMRLSYRKSFYSEFKGNCITSLTFKLKPFHLEKIKEKMYENIHKRTSKQPLDYPNAGSIFKRPEGHYAGTLIENAGLKGKSIGGAMVSPKHAGFIINTGGATAQDVKELIRYIKKTVFEKFGVLLECEIKTLGNVRL